MSELIKWLRLILWVVQFALMYFWRRLKRIDRDETLDQIAEYVEHKHPIQRGRRGTQSQIAPATFHETDKIPAPLPLLRPRNVAELKQHVLEHDRFRAVGSGHSFREVLATEGVLISLERMNKVLNVDGNVVTVEAGIKIRDAIRELEQHGLALRNMGNYDRQSLGGAIVGGTHGTSGRDRTDTFTSSIVELKMISAQGEDVTLGPADSVNFGTGGIVYEVTLKLESFYYLEQKSTNVEPASLNFSEWWNSDALFTFARWNFPGREYEVCQLVEFRKATRDSYQADRSVAVRDRLIRTFVFGAAPFIPAWIRRRSPKFFGNSSFVDKYYYQYVDDPAPHHTEWEYAVSYDADLAGIVAGIPGAVEHIPFTVEVHLRNSPRDAATAHLAHDGDCVWFDLNIVTPRGMTESELNRLAYPFEKLMTDAKGVAHPHKLVVDGNAGGLKPAQKTYLTRFRNAHDPDRRMINSAIERMLGEHPMLPQDDTAAPADL